MAQKKSKSTSYISAYQRRRSPPVETSNMRIIIHAKKMDIPLFKRVSLTMSKRELVSTVRLLRDEENSIHHQIRGLKDRNSSFHRRLGPVNKQSIEKRIKALNTEELSVSKRIEIVTTVLNDGSLDDLDDTFPPTDDDSSSGQ